MNTEPQITVTLGVQELQKVIDLADGGAKARGLTAANSEPAIIEAVRAQLTAKLRR